MNKKRVFTPDGPDLSPEEKKIMEELQEAFKKISEEAFTKSFFNNLHNHMNAGFTYVDYTTAARQSAAFDADKWRREHEGTGGFAGVDFGADFEEKVKQHKARAAYNDNMKWEAYEDATGVHRKHAYEEYTETVYESEDGDTREFTVKPKKAKVEIDFSEFYSPDHYVVAGIALNTSTAKKLLAPFCPKPIPDGNSDGFFFGKPVSLRTYLAESSMIIVRGDQSIEICSIAGFLEAVNVQDN